MTNITQVLKECGIQQDEIAKDLNLGKAAVSAWNRNGVPVIYCHYLEKKTGGKLNRQVLRPKDFHLIWPELDTGTIVPADIPV